MKTVEEPTTTMVTAGLWKTAPYPHDFPPSVQVNIYHPKAIQRGNWLPNPRRSCLWASTGVRLIERVTRQMMRMRGRVRDEANVAINVCISHSEV